MNLLAYQIRARCKVSCERASNMAKGSTLFLVTVVIASGILFGGICVLVGWLIGSSGTTTSETPPGDNQNGDAINGDYYVGVGRYDITGPIAQVNLMGYALPSQTGHGLHMRLYARTFVVSDYNRTNTVVFVNMDNGMGSQLVKLEVVKKLKEKYGDEFNERNIVISGQHTHSSPGGFFQYMMYLSTSFGFVKDSNDAVVNGVIRSIEIARENMKPGYISFATSLVDNGNINRSPYAYDHNPEEERVRYTANTEQTITGIQFMNTDKEPIGLFTWYPVHGTSMNKTNELINPDNKGRASTLYEAMMAKEGELAGQESFVAGFSQANLGDVSPNTAGPLCQDTGEECDNISSTCLNAEGQARVQNCYALGPGEDMFESTDIIGRKQFDAATKFSNWQDVYGAVGVRHQFVDMENEEAIMDDGSRIKTCKAGLGYSFAAGCTDGTGAFNFVQGMTRGTPFWNQVRDLVSLLACTVQPTEEYYDCHETKPVLLPSGYMDVPYLWHPAIVDVQLLRIGQFLIAAVPGEFTTMAGRQLQEKLKDRAIELGLPENTHVVIAGLSNVYSHYTATYEEYQAQRYEDASTLYGPHTHRVYLQKYDALLQAVITNEQLSPGPPPPNLLDIQVELLPKPFVDTVPLGASFGDVISEVEDNYQPGSKVSVTFYGSNPRHDMKLGGTHFEIQRQSGGEWVVEATDTVWETKLIWQMLSEINSTRKQINIIEGLINVIAAHTGFRIELDKLEKLTKMGYAVSGKTKEELVKVGALSKERRKRSILTQSAESHITIEWDIPSNQQSGNYRIVYYGTRKRRSLVHQEYTATSKEFTVTGTR